MPEDSIKVKSRMVTLLATADYFVHASIDVFTKFGPAYVMQRVDYLEDTQYKTNKVRPYVSVGTGYSFDNNVYVNVAYDHLFGSTAKDEKANASDGKFKIRSVNAVQLTVGYNFPV